MVKKKYVNNYESKMEEIICNEGKTNVGFDISYIGYWNTLSYYCCEDFMVFYVFMNWSIFSWYSQFP